MRDVPQLIAAVHTPFTETGQLNIAAIEQQAEFLSRAGAAGVFPGGTTGESLSLTTQERLVLAKQWADVCSGTDMKVIVHTGHNSLPDAIALTQQAGELGLDGFSAMPPSYFKPDSVEDVVAFMAEIASHAPNLPFYYYHIPSMTGVPVSLCKFVELASESIPNLAGIKYSHNDMQQLQELLCYPPERLRIFFGSDEVLLTAWVLGVRGAVGSTYNFMLPLYHQMLADFDAGHLTAAKDKQYQALQVVRVMQEYGFLGASKLAMKMLGVDCGPVRKPLRNLSSSQASELFQGLEPFAELFSGPLARVDRVQSFAFGE